MSKTEELKLTEEQEAIIDIWDAKSDVNTRRIDWVNFAKEILTARPSPPVATVGTVTDGELAKRYLEILRTAEKEIMPEDIFHHDHAAIAEIQQKINTEAMRRFRSELPQPQPER